VQPTLLSLSPSISSLLSPSINILEAKKEEKYGCTNRTRIYAPKSFNAVERATLYDVVKGKDFDKLKKKAY
jgi:hypothetical protein